MKFIAIGFWLSAALIFTAAYIWLKPPEPDYRIAVTHEVEA